jgi:RimJ/RimL family protein N-acetyltransferase
MGLEFLPLSVMPAATWLTLLNDHEVNRHMPLSGDVWTEHAAADWAADKDRQWLKNGYGPWAIRVDGEFAGWGGFQKEGDDADLGIVLLPAFWGCGKLVHAALLAKGFGEIGLKSMTIMLPLSRLRPIYLSRLGYRPEGECEYVGHRFLKFRLNLQEWQTTRQ